MNVQNVETDTEWCARITPTLNWEAYIRVFDGEGTAADILEMEEAGLLYIDYTEETSSGGLCWGATSWARLELVREVYDSLNQIESPFLEPSRWIAQNDYALAMRDNYPVSPGHTLVVPRRIVPTIWECTPKELKAMWELVESQRQAVTMEFSPDGFNIGVNCGEAAGQSVPHAHVHLIPRYNGDHPNPRGGIRAVIPNKANYKSAK